MNISVGSEVLFDKEKWNLLLSPLITMWNQLQNNNPNFKITNKELSSLDPIESFIYLEAS